MRLGFCIKQRPPTRSDINQVHLVIGLSRQGTRGCRRESDHRQYAGELERLPVTQAAGFESRRSCRGWSRLSRSKNNRLLLTRPLPPANGHFAPQTILQRGESQAWSSG